MLKFKRILITVLLSILFIICWYYNNNTKLKLKEIVSNNELLLNLHSTADGYTSILAYSVIYLIPFIFFLYNYFYKENIIILIRKKTRSIGFKTRVKEICISSFIFSFLHICINIMFMFTVFNINYLLENNFIVISLLHMLAIVMFYINVGISFYIFFDVIKILGVAVIVTFICYAGIFFMNKLGYITCWTPNDDLVILGQFLYNNQISLIDIILMYIKEIALFIIINSIGYIIYERKDFLSNEK